jgi:DNA-binding response OmpR family regulator
MDQAEEWDGELAQLWRQSQPLLRERVAVLEEAAVALLEGSLDIGRRRDAQREAHKLAGSLGSFGFHEGSRLAGELESLFQGERPIDQRQALVVSEIVVALSRQIETDPGPRTPPAGTESPTPVVFLTSDGDFGHRVVEAASAAGIDVTVAGEIAAARSVVTARAPGAVLIDARVPGDLDFAADLAAMDPPVAAVVLADPDVGVDRASAAGAGARRYLIKPASPSTVVDALRRALDLRSTGGTVLLVDDDPVFAGVVRSMLESRGFAVAALEDPRLFWEALERVRPDLAVLDFDLPYLDGIQLCRMLRNDAVWDSLPVVFLSSEAGGDRVREMFAAGADDYLAKPVAEADLVARLTNRLQRSRTQRDLAEVDPGTGLPPWRAFVRDAERLVSQARRHRQPLAFACLAVDGAPSLGSVSDPGGGASAQAVLVRALRSALRPGDAVGVDQERRLVAVLAGQEVEEAVERLARVVEALRAEDASVDAGWRLLTASAGVAAFPADGDDATAVAVAAAGALGEARAAGGDRVATSTRTVGARFDVLVVDDDEVVGTLLVHALTTRGYRTMWLQDGAEAAAFLAGGGAPPPRVVLLDVGLPGLDGLSVLRDMARRDALAATRVIMVTLRSSEAEVLEALEIGAFDHVAKPFSVSVLVHRVRRAIESLPP